MADNNENEIIENDELVPGSGEKTESEGTELVPAASAELTETDNTELAVIKEVSGNDEETTEKPSKKIPKWLYITGGIIAGLAVIIIILIVTGLGRKLGVKFISNCIHGKMEKGESMPTLIPTATPTPVVTPDPNEAVTPTAAITEAVVPTEEPKEDRIINFLLLGEENIGGGKNTRGRTDSIVLASFNTAEKKIKLISIMRDSYVQIPGYKDNRINAAYSYGGIPLLFEVLYVNFGITPDQYALVSFENFESIIDSIGGIDIELSKKEASYLNTTNYISDPKNRNVVAGMNHMNGNQAVGYCRIRKVSTKENESSDFGRTNRHREVLEAIAAQLKTLSIPELWSLANEFLPMVMVSQDLTPQDIEEYINLVLDIGLSNITIEGYRIPMDGAYSYATERGMSVVKLDMQKNRDELHRIIYGVTESEAEEGTGVENTAE